MNKGEVLVQQIAQLSGLRFRPLAFTPELESEFRSSTESYRRRRHWLEGLGAIALYALFSLLKGFVLEHGSLKANALRLSLVLPLALVVNASMRRQFPSWAQETGILVVACLASSVELFLNAREPAVLQAYAQLSIVAVLVFTNTVMRLRFKYACAASLWAVLAQAAFLAHSGALTTDEKFFGLFLNAAVIATTLIANYSRSREERLAFLREHHKETIVDELERSNQDLAAVAHSDSLTGLANRAGLNAHIEASWPDLLRSGGTISAILVDVDHFKRLNDEFGHLYGDKVLVRVARLLAEALRREDDFIARFGGEEFLILLPNTPPHLAVLVAERLRGLVELAGLPALPGHDPRLKGKRATVSCGVASALVANLSSPLDVLHAADQALYSAKRAGRNRVHTSSQVDEQMGREERRGQGAAWHPTPDQHELGSDALAASSANA